MADRWMIRGTEFENCNCAWGCPCQFGAKSTQGHCEAFMAGHIEEGSFNDNDALSQRTALGRRDQMLSGLILNI
jgi:hypothetical protein